MLFRNPKCFNTYKNNKKDITHTHTHTHTHTLSGCRRSIHDESYRDRGHVISTATTRLLHALLVGSCHSSGLRSFPVMLWSEWKRKQSALQTGCSLTQSVHHFRLCVSWFEACWWFFTAVHSSVHPSDVMLFVWLRDQTPCWGTQIQSDRHITDIVGKLVFLVWL